MAERSRLTGATGSLAKSARILRVRKLPCRGQVLVKVGDHLEPADVVARCSQQEQVVVLIWRERWTSVWRTWRSTFSCGPVSLLSLAPWWPRGRGAGDGASASTPDSGGT